MFGSKQRRIDKELDAMMKIVPNAYAIIDSTLSMKKENARVRGWAFAASITVAGCAQLLTDHEKTITECVHSTFQHMRMNKDDFLSTAMTDQDLHDYFYDFYNKLMDQWDLLLKHSGVGPESNVDRDRLDQLQTELCYWIEDGDQFIRDEDRDFALLGKSFQLLTLAGEAKTYFTKLVR